MTEQEKREKVIKGLKWCMNEEHDCYREKGCPYENEGEDVGCKYALHRDALELLKAQEARVMTLGEVKLLDSDYYYLESMRSPGKELREIVGPYGLTCVTWPGITGVRQTMGDKGYGKTWRCWTSRPDEKRRAETPWN